MRTVREKMPVMDRNEREPAHFAKAEVAPADGARVLIGFED
jgi:hypothetical protein